MSGLGAGARRLRWRGEAPAKVNLVLRVLAREAGGHHQIETVFQALELSDGVEIERTAERGIRLEVEGVPRGALGPEEENLAVRAARAYLAALGDPSSDPPGFRIALTKRIPHGAGLGGGSSDAAAVLRGLDALHHETLGPARLVEIAARLGADVAFFVLDTPRALGWGRGDRLLTLPALPAREMVLAVPPEPVSTPWAYRMLADVRERRGEEVAPGGYLPAAALETWEGACEIATNAFQEALEPLRPELGRLRSELGAAGAAPALLSGSGSAVFGVFEDAEGADAAAERVRGTMPGARVVRTRTRTRG